MNPLHDYLRVCSGVTATQMWRDLRRSRRLKIMWDGVPTTREAFDAGLAELLADGLAERLSNGAVLWLPRKPEKQLSQQGLFA